MPAKYDIWWLEHFEEYKRFVSEVGKFPSPHANNPIEKKIGVWLHNQIVAHRSGFLPAERLDMLDSFNPQWCEGRRAKFEENKRLLMDSNWKDNVLNGETPIDAALGGDELYFCLKNGMYSCEDFFRADSARVKFAGAEEKVFCVLFPSLDYRCVKLLAAVKRVDWENAAGLDFANELFSNSTYLSAEDMRQKIFAVLETLKPIEQMTILLRYGLLDGKKHFFNELASLYDVSAEYIRQVERNALRKLRHPNRACVLFSGMNAESDALRFPEEDGVLLSGEEEPEVVQDDGLDDIEGLHFSVRTYNALRRAGFKAVQDLLDRADLSSDEPFAFLLDVRSFGPKCYEEVVDVLKEYLVSHETEELSRECVAEDDGLVGSVEALVADANARSEATADNGTKTVSYIKD